MPKPAPSSELRALPAAPDLTAAVGAWLQHLAARAPPVAAHDRGLRARRQAISLFSREAFRRAAQHRRFHRLRAGRSARLSRPSAGGGDRGPLAAARALRPQIARPPYRARRRGNSRGARGCPRAQGRAAPAPTLEPGRRQGDDHDRAARGRRARALGAGARRRGAGALLRRGPAHLGGALDPARRRAGRRNGRDHDRRQGPEVALGADHSRRCAGRSRTICRFAPMPSSRPAPCSSARKAGPCRRASCNWRWRGCAARSACPKPRRPTRSAIRSPRIFWLGEAT